jgi:uncharacterized protein YecE (DUF72 family)
MARILVGLSALAGDLQKIQEKFDLVEVRSASGSWPKDATLKRWRKSVPPAFVFTVVLPPAVAALASTPEAEEALREALKVAAVLQARCLLLQTPPDVRPTSANKKKIAALFEKIPAEGTVRCWEASGLWEPEDVIATARSARVLPVLDAAQDTLPPGAIAYTRLRAMGKAAATSRTMERLAAALRGRREAFVIVEDPKEATAVRGALPALVAKAERALGVPAPMLVRPASAPLVAEDEEQ